MMSTALDLGDRFGILGPYDDAVNQGMGALRDPLDRCGIPVVAGGEDLHGALDNLADPGQARLVVDWVRTAGLTALGFGYCADSDRGIARFASLLGILREAGLLDPGGRSLRALFFAGLPAACAIVRERFPLVSGCFRGDESVLEALSIFGISRNLVTGSAFLELGYDEERLDFGKKLLAIGDYLDLLPLNRAGYGSFGNWGDSLAVRIAQGSARSLPPLLRVDVGPWPSGSKGSFDFLTAFAERLAKGGLLDILSIGSPSVDGPDLPAVSPDDFERIWKASRPMLVRIGPSAGRVLEMARRLEGSLDSAWHGLSFWWTGRPGASGSGAVLANLREQFQALEYLAATGRPFEPDVASHFASRGADDVSCVVAAYLASRAAKNAGVQRLVLQVVLKLPRYTWGTKDLAKARALLHLVRELEDGDFRVYMQTQVGPDYLSPDEALAKAQLAAATAMMADIDPGDSRCPEVIKVAALSGATSPPGPELIEVALRLTRCALEEHRRLKRECLAPDPANSPAVLLRTSEILSEARMTIAAIHSCIAEPYSPEGFLEALSLGFFALPALLDPRDEFLPARKWRTGMRDGAIVILDAAGSPVPARSRLSGIVEAARERSRPR